MGAFHNLNLVSNYQILHSNVFALSMLGMVYYYNAILLRCVRNKPERVKRITKSTGDIKPQLVSCRDS